MRLINVHTRFLREFYDADVPPYVSPRHRSYGHHHANERLIGNLVAYLGRR